MGAIRLCPSTTHRRTRRIRAGSFAIGVATIFVTGCSGAASSVKVGATWSAPLRVESNSLSSDDSSLYGVSCPTVTSCIAVDENGSALFWHSGRWSRPQPVGAGGTLTSVSCPSTTYCVALSAGGSAVTYGGQSWSLPASVGPEGSYKVSCPTVAFCATVGASGTVGAASTLGTFNGHSWSTQQTLGTGAHDDRLMDVSCATRRFCVAVNLNGLTLTFDGQRWSTVPGTGPRGMISLSCPSTSFCLAVADSGAYATFDGRRWSVPSAIPGFGAVFAYSVWCSSTTRCTAIGLSGMAANWQQGRWSEPVRVFPGATRPRWRCHVPHPTPAWPSTARATPQSTDCHRRDVRCRDRARDPHGAQARRYLALRLRPTAGVRHSPGASWSTGTSRPPVRAAMRINSG